MARKQKLLKESSAHLTVLQQEAKFKAETIAADGLEEVTAKKFRSGGIRKLLYLVSNL